MQDSTNHTQLTANWSDSVEEFTGTELGTGRKIYQSRKSKIQPSQQKIQPRVVKTSTGKTGLVTNGVMIQRSFTGRQSAPVPKSIKVVHTGAPDYEGVSSTNNIMNRVSPRNVHAAILNGSKATIIPISQLKNHMQAGMKRSSPKSVESQSPVRIEVQNLSSDESPHGKKRPIRNYIQPIEPDQEVSPSIVQVQKPQLEDLINNKDTEPRRVRNNKEYDNYSPMGVKPGPKPSIDDHLLDERALDRRNRRRASNRQAARKQREKRLMKMQEYEDKIKDLMSERDHANNKLDSIQDLLLKISNQFPETSTSIRNAHYTF